jgi:4-hydroxybutyrate dehydrogenase
MPVIQFVNKVWFEPGAVKRIEAELKRLGIERPLVCTDKGVVAAGLLDSIRAAWPGAAPWIVFDDVLSNPTEKAVLAALALFQAEACDGVVAIGGGSPIDLGKAVNLLASHPEPLGQYEAARKGQGKIGKVGPLIAVPTTAGTGTEVSVGAVIVTADGRKSTIVSPNLIPAVAICDPLLTLKLPPRLTAATGMDAVTHCIEAYLSPLYNPIADAIGLDGLERALGRGALERATADGANIAARSEMMMAALEGALAFVKGLGATHSMSHAAGRIESLKLHHGTLNAVVLPAVLRFNAAHVEEKLQRIALAMGLRDGDEVASAIEALNARLGLPATLGAMGITRDLIDEMTTHACDDLSTLTNPVRPSADDYRTLYSSLIPT